MISGLNQRFFNKKKATDVIAFPLGDNLDPDYLGEVVVSVETAVAECAKYNLIWEEELILYLIHGILHLLGFSDATKKKREVMGKKQNEILKLVLK